MWIRVRQINEKVCSSVLREFIDLRETEDILIHIVIADT